MRIIIAYKIIFVFGVVHLILALYGIYDTIRYNEKIAYSNKISVEIVLVSLMYDDENPVQVEYEGYQYGLVGFGGKKLDEVSVGQYVDAFYNEELDIVAYTLEPKKKGFLIFLYVLTILSIIVMLFTLRIEKVILPGVKREKPKKKNKPLN